MLECFVLPKTVCYQTSIELMQNKVEQVISDKTKAYLLLTEYDDLYTLGSTANMQEVLDIGDIPLFKTNRGGKVTYHGPGQRIIYPIIHLCYFNYDLRQYLTFLANILIQTFASIGLTTFYCPEKIGIWIRTNTQELKIASIGIKIKKWVAYHGISVNIAPNLAQFDKIIACGLNGYKHTSLKNLNIDISFGAFDMIIKERFSSQLNRLILSEAI